MWRYGRVFSRAWVHTHTVGLEHIPPWGPVILAGNHRSHSDIPAVVGALSRRIVFAANDELWDTSRILAFVLDTQGCPRVHHSGVDRQALNDCVAMLERDRILGIFPEGGLHPEGLAPFEAGAAFLAVHTGAPLVPFGLAGTLDAWGNGEWPPIRSRRVMMVVGEPLYPNPDLVRRAATRDLTERLRHAVEACVARAERIRARALGRR